MEKLPLISIILPTYNRSNYIIRMIDSILRQDYPNFEIVIFDDCSTDNTEDMIRKMYSKDNRIRYIKREENLGSLTNTADAILNFEFGEWVILIGDDDIFIYNHYFSEAMSLVFKDEEIVMVCSNFYGVNRETLEILKSFNYANLFQRQIENGKDIFFRNRKCPGYVGGAAIYKTKILKRIYQEVSLDNLLADNQSSMCSLFYGKIAFIDKYPCLWSMNLEGQNFDLIKKDDKRNIGNSVEIVKWIYRTAKTVGKITENELDNYLSLMFVKIYYRLFKNFSMLNTSPKELIEYIKNKDEEFAIKLVNCYFSSNRQPIDEYNNFVICGTGEASLHVSMLLKQLNKNLYYYIDDFKNGENQGLQIYKTYELNGLPKPDIYIIAVYNQDKEEFIRVKLQESGINDEIIYTPKEIFATELNKNSL